MPEDNSNSSALVKFATPEEAVLDVFSLDTMGRAFIESEFRVSELHTRLISDIRGDDPKVRQGAARILVQLVKDTLIFNGRVARGTQTRTQSNADGTQDKASVSSFSLVSRLSNLSAASGANNHRVIDAHRLGDDGGGEQPALPAERESPAIDLGGNKPPVSGSITGGGEGVPADPEDNARTAAE